MYDLLKYIQRIALPAVLTFLATVLPLLGVDDDAVRIIAAVGAAIITLGGALMEGWYQAWKRGEENG